MSDNVIAPLPVRAPLVSQTAAAIRARIEAGRWQFGEQLPSEPQLANELGISRGTLRESVGLLISDGLLDRRHGVGTFVARVPPPTIDRGIDELFGAGDAIAQMGYLPSVGACSIELTPAPDVVARELRVPRGTPVCHLERVRLADGRPVVLCHDYIEAQLLREREIPLDAVERRIQLCGGSLYAWLERDLGRTIDTALAHIEPVVATREIAAALAVPRGSALLRLRQTHFGPDGAEILYSDNLHNSELMHFHVLRQRARPTF
jgi:GntR family transcriptional regulator